MSDVHSGDSTGARSDPEVRAARRLTLDLDPFVWEALKEESAQLGVSVEELARFSMLYYLADRDSGRIARRLPTSQPSEEPHPLGKLLS
ncbi:MAG TPA: hypothetical protein VNY52_06305 [Solirubrobacteraceae bacterium]|nr:hypothetical protein [Solirubrobacteraceae bacterium]